MKLFKLITLIAHLATLWTRVSSDDDELPTISKLREDLLVKQRYDRNVRPVKNHLTATMVGVWVSIIAITDLDIQTGIMTINAVLVLRWKDEHLTWDPNNYHGLSSLIYSRDEIWVPDVAVWEEHVDGSTGLANQAVTGESDGSILWYPKATYRYHCRLDLSDFPYDKQLCTLYFSTWTHYTSEVNLTFTGLAGPFNENPEYRVSRFAVREYLATYDAHNQTYSVIKLGIGLERRSSLYTYNVVIPYVVATLLALTVFVLPLHSRVRLFFSGLSVLVLVLLMMFVGNMVGTHSINVPYAVKCIGINILFVGLAAAATQLNSRMFFGLSVECPARLVALLSNPILSCVLCLGGAKSSHARSVASLRSEDSSGPPFGSKPSNDDWSLVAIFCDRLLMVTYSLAILIYHS